MSAGQDICALSHKVHTTEDDEFCRTLLGGSLSQLERVASDIGELDYLIALIVVAKNHYS
jgi:hypothetical protein